MNIVTSFFTASTHRAVQLFHFLGVFLAKALQDNMLVDIPISRPFLKYMCQGEFGNVKDRSVLQELKSRHDQPSFNSSLSASLDSISSSVTSSMASSMISDEGGDSLGSGAGDTSIKARLLQQLDSVEPWFSNLLTLDDVTEVYGEYGQFLQQLATLSATKHRILADQRLSPQQRTHQLANLTLPPPPKVTTNLSEKTISIVAIKSCHM